MKTSFIKVISLPALLCISTPALAECRPEGITTSPTNTDTTFIREGNGQFGSGRSGGSHGGTDIIVNASYDDKSAYAVFAVASGTVAYARMNGTDDTGYGNTVVIDHGNDCYSLYAHLANDPFTPSEAGGNLEVSVGDDVNAGDIIGYFVRTNADIDSTGNARTTHPEARHQTHFELISAPSGRTGTGSLGSSIMASPAERIDPEPFLMDQGLNIEKS